MRSRNRVELIGNLGSDPEAIVFDNGTMKVSISVATSEVYKNRDTGETVENTEFALYPIFIKILFRSKRLLGFKNSRYYQGES